VGRLWVRGPDGQPVPVEVRTGLTDGTSTELLEGPLKAGDEVILGAGETAAGAKKAGGPTGPRLF
jgi:HlyD family secretion protein